MITHSKPTIESSDIMAVARVLRSKQIASGMIAEQFRNALKIFFKAKQVLLTPSGTAAIVEALRLLNVKRGDEVIVPAYVCSSVARAVELAGAAPRAADITLDNYAISYADARKKVTARTKAIIVPHVFGNPVTGIQMFRKLGVPIIEDVAQAIGGKYDGKRLGSFGDMAICSFYATKMMTTGEGGALVIHSSGLSARFQSVKYLYRMPDVQAALGLSQLRKINAFIRRRQKLFQQYVKGLQRTSGCSVSNPKGSSYYRCIIEVDKAATLRGVAKMRKHGIAASRFSDLVFNYLKLPPKDYPNTEWAMERVVSFPLYPSLTKQEINSVINVSKKAFMIDKKGKK